MLRFQPAAGTILNCDFSGYIEPEIVKNRQVVVLHKHRSNAKLVYIVPLSTTPPRDASLVHQLDYIPIPRPNQTPENTTVWVKCDLVYTISIERLSMPMNRASRRQAATPINISISIPDLMSIRSSVARAMRLQ